MSALPVIDQSDVPAGYERRWEPVKDDNGYSGNWRVVTGPECDLRRCRWGAGFGKRSCRRPSVAKMNRGREREQWWHYCEDHLYGRIVVDGVIYYPVFDHSPPRE